MKTLAACLATVALAVPAGWHSLDADIQADGPKVRPDIQTLDLGDAQVSLQLDRGVMPTAGTVSAILVATGDTPHQVTVDLTTMEDMGFGGERVPNPPVEVDHRKLVLQAQPGGGPPIVASIKLGTRDKRNRSLGIVSWYDLYLTPHGAKSPRNRWDEGAGAHAGIATWSGNAIGLAIEPPATMPAEGPFTIALRIKNTTKQPLAYIEPAVGGRISSWSSFDSMFQLASDDYDITPIDEPAVTPTVTPPSDGESDSDNPGLAPGAEQLEIYRVTPKRAGIKHFTFVAHVRASGGGAMEVASFDRPDAPAPDEAPAGKVAAN